MAGVYELDVATYIVDESGGIERYRAVVEGSSEHRASYPSAADVPAIGIAKETRDDGEAIAIVKRGRTYAEMSGSGSAGDYLNVAGTSGKLQAIPSNSTPQRYECVGMAEEDFSDGDVIIVDVHPRTIYS